MTTMEKYNSSEWVHPNNGLRRRMIYRGRACMEAVEMALRCDVDGLAAWAVVNLGGISQPRTWARSMIAAVRRKGVDLPAHPVQVGQLRDGRKYAMIAHVSWTWQGDKQVAVVGKIAGWGGV